MATARKRLADHFTDSEESDFDFTDSDESDPDEDSEFLMESEEESDGDESPRTSVYPILNGGVVHKRQTNVQSNQNLARKSIRNVVQRKETNGRTENKNKNRPRIQVGSIKSVQRKQTKGKNKKDLPMNEWSSARAPPPNFQFNETTGLKLHDESLTPAQFMDLFLDDAFMDLLVEETNKYAIAVIEAKGQLRPSSRLIAWSETNKTELKIFFGLLLHMGEFSLPSIEHYWRENELYSTSFWRSRMSRNRFQILLRFLHFADNTSQNNDRLYKINPVLQHFNKIMEKIYSPKREICIDESMVLWRGRLVFRQYMKDKRHPYGVKLYELCESSGIVLKIQIYAGKSVTTITTEQGTSITAQVVMELMEGFLDKGYILYADNFYNSVSLTKTLTARSTYLCGTLRKNRKENPKEVVKQKLMRGELSYLRSDSVIVCKWRDKRDVLTISNMHEVELIDVANRNGKISIKPNIIRDYNLGMGGIDRADQMMSYYSSLRKTIRWYKKLGIHFIEVFIQNAYWIYLTQQNVAKMSLLSFRESIVKYLAGKPTRDIATNSSNSKIKKPDVIPHNFHYLDSIHPTKNKKFPTKQCAECSKKNRRETRYFCPVCPNTPALCVVDCFRKYHLTNHN